MPPKSAWRDRDEVVGSERGEGFGEVGFDVGELAHLRDGGPRPHRRASESSRREAWRMVMRPSSSVAPIAPRTSLRFPGS